MGMPPLEVGRLLTGCLWRHQLALATQEHEVGPARNMLLLRRLWPLRRSPPWLEKKQLESSLEVHLGLLQER